MDRDRPMKDDGDSSMCHLHGWDHGHSQSTDIKICSDSESESERERTKGVSKHVSKSNHHCHSALAIFYANFFELLIRISPADVGFSSGED